MKLDEWGWHLSDWIADSKGELILSAIRENRELLNASGETFDTPLVAASSYDNFQLVKALVNFGADIDYITETGDSAISILVNKDDSFLISNKALIYLLKHKAKPDVICLDGWSPLHITAMHNKVLKSAILIKYGASINVRDRTFGETPLHRAVKFNCYDVAYLLMKCGADYNIKDSYGESVLSFMDSDNEIDLYRKLKNKMNATHIK